MLTIKKYSNRRLYDPSQSRYITMEELAQKIRQGHEVKVVDAKSDEDLTQSVLAQIILESRGAASQLPVRLLMQLIRMEDDALSEFFTQYVSWALSAYLKLRRGAARMGPLNPIANPFLQQMMAGIYGWPGAGAEANPYAPPMMQGGPQGRARAPGRQGAPGVAPPAFHEDDAFDDFSKPVHAPPEPSFEPEQAHEPEPEERDQELASMRQELDEIKQLLRQVASGQGKK